MSSSFLRTARSQSLALTLSFLSACSQDIPENAQTAPANPFAQDRHYLYELLHQNAQHTHEKARIHAQNWCSSQAYKDNKPDINRISEQDFRTRYEPLMEDATAYIKEHFASSYSDDEMAVIGVSAFAGEVELMDEYPVDTCSKDYINSRISRFKHLSMPVIAHEGARKKFKALKDFAKSIDDDFVITPREAFEFYTRLSALKEEQPIEGSEVFEKFARDFLQRQGFEETPEIMIFVQNSMYAGLENFYENQKHFREHPERQHAEFPNEVLSPDH